MSSQNIALNYVVTLSNNSMPFSDDATYDVKEATLLKANFETEKEAKKFFKEKVKELNLRQAGRSKSLFGNSQYELYLAAVRVN